jgi:hypothetical protein
MQFLLDSLLNPNSPLTAEGRRATSELATRQQQERSALEQKIMQSGGDPGRARVELAMLRDKQEGELNDLAAQFGIAGTKQKMELAGTLATQGMAGQRFEAEQRATELKTKLDKAALLLSAGGANNITAAAAVYNEVYPGLGIDFTKVITADKAATFNKGLSSISSYVAAGLDWNEALTAMRKDGTFDMLGMTEEQAEALYNAENVNVIDEQWNAIAESNWYKNLSPEDKTAMSTFFTSILTGDLDYQVSYDVKDASGAILSSFTTQAEANTYAANHPGSAVASRIVPRTTTAPTAAGTAQATILAAEIPKKTDGTNYAQGEIFTVNGKLYKVGSDNNGALLTIPDGFDFTGADARAIVSFGRQNNNLYDQVINGVKTKAEAGTITWENINGLASTDPIYTTVLSNMPITADLTGLEGEALKGKLVKVNIPGVGETLARFDGWWDNHNKVSLKSADGGSINANNSGYGYLMPDGRYVQVYSQGYVVVDGVRIK